MNSPILRALAARYRASAAGSMGDGTRDFTIDYKQLLKAAKTTDGDELATAEHDLRTAVHESGRLLSLDTLPRDERVILRVRIARDGGEAWLFQHLGQATPTALRRRLADIFREALQQKVPDVWRDRWDEWLLRLATHAVNGGTVSPFAREEWDATAEMLEVLAAVLQWPGESFVRFASSLICGNSKRLETLQPRLEQALAQISAGSVTALDQLGLSATPRVATVHGPLRLEMKDGVLDTGLLSGHVCFSEHDIRKASHITTTAAQCLTVENVTTFHELAKLRTNTLLIQTSYPGGATLALLERLRDDLPCWHFGDTDAAGYDILRDLRDRTGRSISALHMEWHDDPDSPSLTDNDQRTIKRLLGSALMSDVHFHLEAMLRAGRKGRFEQERLGWPTQTWPFYPNPFC